MRVLNVGDAMERITNALSILTTTVKLHNSRGRTDINKDAEDFYCGLLSIVLGKNLKNLNLLEMNFAAIDLADEEGRLCVQVTSTEGRNKVDRTLEKFFAKELDKQFDRLIVLIIGEKPQYQRDFTTERGFDFAHERDVWDLPKLLLEIERLDAEKVKEVDEYLSPRVNTGRQEKQYPNLPLRTTLEGDAFIGRAGELAEIDRRFRTERVLFLTGLGGMGKTELAVRYARDYVQAKGHQAYMVLFSGNFRQTMLNNVAPNIPDLDTNGMHENEIYRKTLESLNRCGADALLILDNADQANLMDLRRDLGALAMRVLVTTRQDVERAIDVDQLHREELHRLFDQHEAQVTPEEMDKLVEAVDGHTLTVDLMARLLHRERRSDTCRALLDALNKRDLNHTEFGTVAAAFPGALSQARVNEHLKAVFRVSDMTDAEQAVLRFGALLPDCGLDSRLFTEAAQNALRPPEPEQQRGFFARLFGKRTKPTRPAGIPKVSDLLKDLADRGWLDWEGDLLRIHPVIRLVCIEELSPTVENCEDFLHWFEGQFDKKTSYEWEKFAQIASLYEIASEVLKETDGKWIVAAGYLWNVLVEPRRALTCNHRAVELLEQNAPGSSNLATAYNNLGSAYGALGDHGKELEYKLKDLEICEQVLPPTHPALATSYNNVGMAYGALGDHEKELEYQLKDLAICEQVLPSTHPDLATSYNNVGTTYGDLGDHEKALEYQLKALEIREQVLPPTHPDLAQSYNNVGGAYGCLGDHEKALEYQLKALEIRGQVLPPTHPDLATSYNNVGGAYGCLGDHEKELEYQIKALAIREQVLLPTHPDLATSYNNVGSTYLRLGDHEKALEYQLKALSIQEQSLQPDHPYNVFCRINIAHTYAQMEDFIQANEYMRRALDSAERSMRGHPDLERYRQLAQIMGLCAMFQEAGMPLPFDNPFKQM